MPQNYATIISKMFQKSYASIKLTTMLAGEITWLWGLRIFKVVKVIKEIKVIKVIKGGIVKFLLKLGEGRGGFGFLSLILHITFGLFP